MNSYTTLKVNPLRGLWQWRATRVIVLIGSMSICLAWGSSRWANEDRDARPVVFDRQAYRDRNIVERLIGWLKECRRIFSRFEKTAKNFGGMIKMAFIQRYLRLAVK